MADAAVTVAALTMKDKLIIGAMALVVGGGSGVASSQYETDHLNARIENNEQALAAIEPRLDAIDRKLIWVDTALGFIYQELTGKDLPSHE